MARADYGIQAVLSVVMDTSGLDQGLAAATQKTKSATDQIDKQLEKAEKSYVDLANTVQQQMAKVSTALNKSASAAQSSMNTVASSIKRTQTVAVSMPTRPFTPVPRHGAGVSVFTRSRGGLNTGVGTPLVNRIPPIPTPVVPAIPAPAPQPAIPASPLSAGAQTAIARAQQAQGTIATMQAAWAMQTNLKSQTAAMNRMQRRMEAEVEREKKLVSDVIARSLSAPAAIQAAVINAIKGPQAQAQRQRWMANGQTLQQAMATQLIPAVGAANAPFLVGAGGRRPPMFGGTPPGGGRGGPLGMFGKFAGGIASGLGIGLTGLGGYAAIQAGRAVMESVETATAYDRQELAARNLAGTQEELNRLLDAYAESSGGAVDQATELSNVTRLLATGYARNATELERFVRATRGASIALGKEQDYVIQETQLAISNVSQKRLDQIGLGITEVTDRIEKLRASNKEWSRETAFQEAVLSLMEEKYGDLTDSVEGQATGVERLRKAWADLRLEMGQQAQGPVNAFAGGLANAMDRATANAQMQQRVISELQKDPTWKPGINASEEERKFAEGMRAGMQTEEGIQEFLDNLNHGLNRFFLNLYRYDYDALLASRGPQFRDPVPAWMTGASAAAMPERRLSGFRSMSEERQAVIEQGYQAEQDLIKRHNERRIQEIEQYESQRASLVSNFAKSMVREEEDFYRQRARGQRDYERSIMDMLRESRERESEWQEDLDERIADLRQRGNEQLAEIEENYQKDQSKALRQHRDALMKAAGQLDAIAVLEERKRFREEQREREEQHKEQVEEVKENLQEQIDEANEAHKERLEDGRKADEKRLQEMRIARERQLADEDEDRELRKQRAIEDHNAQLEEMDRLHGERMLQLAEEAEDERKLLNDALAKDLAAVGIYVKGYHEKMLERDKLIDRWFNNIIDRLEREIEEERLSRYAYDPKTGPQIPTNYGRAILDSSPVASASGIMGSSMNSRNLVIQSGAITIYAAPGMSEEEIGNIAIERVIEYMEAQ